MADEKSKELSKLEKGVEKQKNDILVFSQAIKTVTAKHSEILKLDNISQSEYRKHIEKNINYLQDQIQLEKLKGKDTKKIGDLQQQIWQENVKLLSSEKSNLTSYQDFQKQYREDLRDGIDSQIKSEKEALKYRFFRRYSPQLIRLEKQKQILDQIDATTDKNLLEDDYKKNIIEISGRERRLKQRENLSDKKRTYLWNAKKREEMQGYAEAELEARRVTLANPVKFAKTRLRWGKEGVKKWLKEGFAPTWGFLNAIGVMPNLFESKLDAEIKKNDNEMQQVEIDKYDLERDMEINAERVADSVMVNTDDLMEIQKDAIKRSQKNEQETDKPGKTETSSTIPSITSTSDFIPKLDAQLDTLNSIDDTLKEGFLKEKKSKEVKSKFEEIKPESELKESPMTFGKDLGKQVSTIFDKKEPEKDLLRTDDLTGKNKEQEKTNEILETISGNTKPRGKGLGLLGLMGLMAGAIAIGGLIGFLLTGKSEFLFSTVKGLHKGALVLKKMFSIFGDMGKLFGGLFKTVGKEGAKEGAKFAAKTGGKSFLKRIPGLGAIMGLIFGIARFRKGDVLGGLLEITSGLLSLDVTGTVGLALGIAIDAFLLVRDFKKSGAEKAGKKQGPPKPGMFTKIFDMFLWPFKFIRNVVKYVTIKIGNLLGIWPILKTFSDKIVTTFTNVKEFMGKMWDAFKQTKTFGVIVDVLDKTMAGLKVVWEKTKSVFGTVMDWIGEFTGFIGGIASKVGGFIGKIFGDIKDAGMGEATAQMDMGAPKPAKPAAQGLKDFIASKPTRLLVGENEPERVNVQPLSDFSKFMGKLPQRATTGNAQATNPTQIASLKDNTEAGAEKRLDILKTFLKTEFLDAFAKKMAGGNTKTGSKGLSEADIYSNITKH